MLRLFVLVLMTAVMAAPASAQSRRELAARLDAAEARIAELESTGLAGDPLSERIIVRMDALEREQRAMTGEIERLEFENRRLRGRIDQLEARLDALTRPVPAEGAMAEGGMGEDGPAELASGAAAASSEADADAERAPERFADARAEATGRLSLPRGQGAPASEQAPGGTEAPLSGASATAASPEDLFMEGRSRLFDGDFAGAQESFEAFTGAYPEDGLAGEAWYWLGETRFIQGDHAGAAEAYLASLRADGRGPVAPDAGVRLAASLAATGDTAGACELLAAFPRRFPNADAEARRKAEREAARAGCR